MRRLLLLGLVLALGWGALPGCGGPTPPRREIPTRADRLPPEAPVN